jgi:hypothetical protein
MQFRWTFKILAVGLLQVWIPNYLALQFPLVLILARQLSLQFRMNLRVSWAKAQPILFVHDVWPKIISDWPAQMC